MSSAVAVVAARVSPSLQSGALSPTLFDQSDEHYIQALAHGDSEAIDVLYSRYRRLVYSIALRIVRDASEAEDVTQTVFIDIFRAATLFDCAKGTLKVWLLQYAYHRAFHRKRNLVARRYYDRVSLHTIRFQPASREFASIVQSSYLANQLMSTLNPRQRAVVELKFYEGLTAQEISDELDQSVHVVRHDLRRAINAMKEFGSRSAAEARGC